MRAMLVAARRVRESLRRFRGRRRRRRRRRRHRARTRTSAAPSSRALRPRNDVDFDNRPL